MEERIKPIRITDKETDTVYELDFSRESVVYAEKNGFNVNIVFDFPNTMFRDFFYYAFRKNHRSLSREKVDKIFDKLGGLTAEFVNRLVALYNQAGIATLLKDEEDYEKNEKMTVEF